MPVLLFYLFAALVVGFALAVVLARNPVTSALCLAVSFVGLAALFLSLDAYFIGTLQVLVYAGAVMVLFLFIIMLMDVKAEESSARSRGAQAAGFALAVLLLIEVVSISSALKRSGDTLGQHPISAPLAAKLRQQSGRPLLKGLVADLAKGELPDAKLMGEALFGRHVFHLQLVGLLLVVATVGVVALSRKDGGSLSS